MKPSDLPASVAEFSKAAGPAASGEASGLRRITFVVEPSSETKARREYTHPRRVVAVEERLDLANLAEAAEAESADAFQVALIPASTLDTLLPRALGWLTPDEKTAGQAPITLTLKSGASVAWKPGKAILHSAGEQAEPILSTLIDFAFVEAEVRALEAIVEAQEPLAAADVGIAHRVSGRDKAQSKRIGETIQRLALARLTFARLESAITRKPRFASADCRRLYTRLVARADIVERLESLSFRLEVLEDLYERANDRIADDRGRKFAHRLGYAILAILSIELVVLVVGLLLRRR